MRIIILADPLDNQRAGIHYYTRNLVVHLNKLDTESEYFLIRRKRDDLFRPDRQIIVKNYRFPGYAALRMFFIVPRLIARLRADVVVEPAHFGPFNLPGKIKRVTVIHDLTPILFPHLHRFHSQILQRVFLKGILRRAALIITNSENTRLDVLKYLPSAEGKTESIYLGRDELIAGKTDNEDLGADGPGKARPNGYFLYVGTIEPRKNLECLLKAYTLFRMHGNGDHKLIIAGHKGWKSHSFYGQLKRNPYKNDISLLGYMARKELHALYSHATAFIFPSFYEGFGLPVVEALSAGTPCLLSDTSSLPEVGGDAALYFDPQKPAQLAELMQKISEDTRLRQELAGRAKDQAAKFSWHEHAKKFDQVIKKLKTI